MAGKGSFIWYELLTPDTKASEAFYKSVVGWNTQVFEGNQDYTVLSAGDRGVGGLMKPPEGGPGPVWIGYVGVADTDAAVASAKAAGAQVHREPWDIPNVGRLAMLTDPQGAAFMLMTPSGEDDGQKPAMGTPGHIGWRELHTTDWEKAFAFYSEQFGWAKGEAMDMGPEGTYQIVTDGGEQFGAMFKSSQMPRPAWLVYFNVASIDAAVEKVKAGGGQVINGPMEVPGGQWIINGIDPQGAMFALVGAR